MKIDRVLELLKIERECVTRQSPCNEKSKLCDRNCGECDIAQNDLEIIEMYNFVISMIETLNGVSQWISVKDRLPENSDTVLITHKGGVSFGWYNGRYWERGASTKHREIRTVSHWMPLPKAPEGSEPNENTL